MPLAFLASNTTKTRSSKDSITQHAARSIASCRRVWIRGSVTLSGEAQRKSNWTGTQIHPFGPSCPPIPVATGQVGEYEGSHHDRTPAAPDTNRSVMVATNRFPYLSLAWLCAAFLLPSCDMNPLFELCVCCDVVARCFDSINTGFNEDRLGKQPTWSKELDTELPSLTEVVRHPSMIGKLILEE